jgi:hypothetical protein
MLNVELGPVDELSRLGRSTLASAADGSQLTMPGVTPKSIRECPRSCISETFRTKRTGQPKLVLPVSRKVSKQLPIPSERRCSGRGGLLHGGWSRIAKSGPNLGEASDSWRKEAQRCIN